MRDNCITTVSADQDQAAMTSHAHNDARYSCSPFVAQQVLDGADYHTATCQIPSEWLSTLCLRGAET